MERAGFILEARTEAGEGGGDRMVACEVEAAEALEGLARCSALLGGSLIFGELKRQLVTHPQEKSMAAQDFNDFTSIRNTSPEKIEKIVENIPSKLRGRICQSNSLRKSRPKLTEGEKQARKLRRILANREAARETIRRRQAMFQDLNKKAADVLEENENLKKEKELAVEEYNSLKDRNEFLKSQLLAETKKTEPVGDHIHMQEDPKPFRPEKSCSRPIGPSIVPCFWPPIFPPSDAFVFQCAPTSSSRFPLFLYPIPCSFSFFAHGTTTPPHHCSTCLCSEVLPHENSSHLTTNRDMREGEASSSRKSMTVECVRGAGSTTSPPESGGEGTTRHPDGTIFVPGLFTRVKPQGDDDVGVGLSRESEMKMQTETQDILAAAEARRKRKELMKMKNSPSRHHVNTGY